MSLVLPMARPASPDKPEVVRYDSDGSYPVSQPLPEKKQWVTDRTLRRWLEFHHRCLSIKTSGMSRISCLPVNPGFICMTSDGDGVPEILVIKNQNSFMGSSVLEQPSVLRQRTTGMAEVAGGTASQPASQYPGPGQIYRGFRVRWMSTVMGNLEVVAAVVQKTTRNVTIKRSSYIVDLRLAQPIDRLLRCWRLLAASPASLPERLDNLDASPVLRTGILRARAKMTSHFQRPSIPLKQRCKNTEYTRYSFVFAPC